MIKKYALKFAFVVALIFPGAGTVFGQDNWPQRPIEVIVGYAAGNATDHVARIVADAMSKKLGQPVVVMNKPGASGAFAGNDLAKRPPDGYSIGFFNANQPTPELNLNPEMFHYKTGDLVPVAQISGYALVMLVRYDAPYKTFEEFIAYAKAHPGKLVYGHNGKGGILAIIGDLIQQKAGISMLDVPFRGGLETQTALLGGHIDATVTVLYKTTLEHETDKKMRALILMTPDRNDLKPELRTIAEAGYDLGIPMAHIGVFVRKGVPENVIKKLSGTIKDVLGSPQVVAQFRIMGYPMVYRDQAEYEKFVLDYGQVQFEQFKRLGLR